MATTPRDASTILPLRETDAGLEVFMVKRHSKLGFLGGMHVFPGGAVDTADRAPANDELLGSLDGPRSAELLGIEDPDRARGLVVAAIRELFEEAGILLAHTDDGEWVDLEDGSARATRLLDAREPVAAGEADFAALLRAEGLVLGAEKLRYFDHWITPEREKKRFDTRFFLAPAPRRQTAAHDGGESTEGEWITPTEAMARYRAKALGMMPPTIISLERLLPHATFADAAAAADAFDIVEVLPKVSVRDDDVTLLYPRDDDYASGLAEPPATGRRLDRLRLEDGLWVRP